MTKAEELLNRLLEHFYDNFIWGYREDTELREFDPDLALELHKWQKRNG